MVCSRRLRPTCSNLVKVALGLAQTSDNFLISFIWLFAAAPFWVTLSYTCEALSAVSGRQQYRIGCLAAVVAIPVYVVTWYLVPAILGRLGHPVF